MGTDPECAKKLFIVLVAAAAALVGPALAADNYPSRPITFVAPFGPGSATDTLCRIIGDQLNAALKTPVIVEDRPAPTERSPRPTSRAPLRTVTR